MWVLSRVVPGETPRVLSLHMSSEAAYSRRKLLEGHLRELGIVDIENAIKRYEVTKINFNSDEMDE